VSAGEEARWLMEERWVHVSKVREKKPKTGGGGKLRIFSENRGRPVALFFGKCLAAGMLGIYREIAGGTNERSNRRGTPQGGNHVIKLRALPAKATI
jgi:hypothetical protein